jgi:hypothetical protein
VGQRDHDTALILSEARLTSRSRPVTQAINPLGIEAGDPVGGCMTRSGQFADLPFLGAVLWGTSNEQLRHGDLLRETPLLPA